MSEHANKKERYSAKPDWQMMALIAVASLVLYGCKYFMRYGNMESFDSRLWEYVGIAALLIGVADSGVEASMDLGLFYGTSQRGGSNANSGIICVLGIALVSGTWLKCAGLTILVMGVVGIIRYVISYKQCEKANKYVGRVGEAVGNISYKGLGEFDEEILKVRIEKGKIRHRERIRIEKLNGFHLVVNTFQEPEERYKEISQNGGTIRVLYRDIICIVKEKRTKYVLYKTLQGNYRERNTLQEAISGLDVERFITADRSCVVNKEHIVSLKENMLLLDNGEEIAVGRSHLKSIKNILEEQADKKS